MPISFTIDLEDPTERYKPDGRYVDMTRKILGLCDEFRCRATFFVVGSVAEANPQLIKDIAAKGHEIACHSHAHVPLTEEDPVRFYGETEADKKLLEDLSGKSVKGFRAPRFSLVPESKWTLDIIKELGFVYSSSIMPTVVSLYGYPGTPRTPFRWSNGLVEFPLPVADVQQMHIPYLGGIYMYAMPSMLTQKWIKAALPKEVLWTYTHPYDFDKNGPIFSPMAHTAAWVSVILRLARFVAEGKVRKVLSMGVAPPLGERIPEDLPTFKE